MFWYLYTIVLAIVCFLAGWYQGAWCALGVFALGVMAPIIWKRFRWWLGSWILFGVAAVTWRYTNLFYALGVVVVGGLSMLLFKKCWNRDGLISHGVEGLVKALTVILVFIVLGYGLLAVGGMAFESWFQWLKNDPTIQAPRLRMPWEDPPADDAPVVVISRPVQPNRVEPPRAHTNPRTIAGDVKELHKNGLPKISIKPKTKPSVAAP